MEGNPTIFPYELTEHSKKRLSEREIPLEWIERVLFSPQRTEPDPINPTAVLAFAAIPEAGDRVLYGAKLYRDGKAPIVIVSGGRIGWLGGGLPESTDMGTLLAMMGVPDSAIIEEPNSLNTYENAVNVQKILDQMQESLSIATQTLATAAQTRSTIAQKLGV